MKLQVSACRTFLSQRSLQFPASPSDRTHLSAFVSPHTFVVLFGMLDSCRLCVQSRDRVYRYVALGYNKDFHHGLDIHAFYAVVPVFSRESTMQMLRTKRIAAPHQNLLLGELLWSRNSLAFSLRLGLASFHLPACWVTLSGMALCRRDLVHVASFGPRWRLRPGWIVPFSR